MGYRLRLAVAVGLVVLSLGVAGGIVDAAGTSCSRSAPLATIDNNWAWGAPGSWGLPGQQLTYAIQVRNYDIGCSASSFVISLSAPDGFSVSVPTDAISLKSSSSGYLWGYVTSPNAIPDGDYPVIATVRRANDNAWSAPYTSYFKVYSSDTSSPSLFWPNPGDGTTITGRSYIVTVSSSDDHDVRKIDLYIDNVYRATTSCDDVSYTCQLAYKWSLRGAKGQHTATFQSYDWLGNTAVYNVSFNVN